MTHCKSPSQDIERYSSKDCNERNEWDGVPGNSINGQMYDKEIGGKGKNGEHLLPMSAFGKEINADSGQNEIRALNQHIEIGGSPGPARKPKIINV